MSPLHKSSAGLLVACLCTAALPAAATDKTADAASSPASTALGASIDGPTQILLSKQQPVQLLLRAPSEFTPELFVNVGSLSKPTRKGPEKWSFTYHPPQERYPQVALIAALGKSGQEIAVHRIDLLGTPKIRFKSEPNVLVHVHVRDQIFGPVRTDSRGRGRIEVNVPPGQLVAKTRGTDDHGNTTTRNLPLDVPPFNRHLLVCSKNAKQIFLISVAANGTPNADADVDLLVSHGSTTGLQALEPGLFSATWEADPANHTQTNVLIEVRTAAQDATVAQCSRATPVPPKPVILTLPEDIPPAIPEPPSRWRLGLRAGGGSNGARVSGPWASARLAHTNIPQLPELVLGIEAGIYASTDSSETTDGTEVTIEFLGTPVFLRTAYERSWGNLLLQGTLGLGAVFSGVTVKTDTSEQQVQDTSILYGGSVSGGYQLGPGHLMLEAGYWWSAFESENITGNIMGLNATLGYFFAL